VAFGEIRGVYLRAYDSVGEARASLGRYLDFYNRRRPHSSLDARTPDRAYFDTCLSLRQHDIRRRCRGITPVGLRPPCVTPRQRHIPKPDGRDSTYRSRNGVSTNPATSLVNDGPSNFDHTRRSPENCASPSTRTVTYLRSDIPWIDDWSKTFRNRPLSPDDRMTVFDRVVQRVAGTFADVEFVWLGNKDVSDNIFKGRGYRLPNSPHGLNVYQHIHHAVILSALNPPPAHFAFLDALGLKREVAGFVETAFRLR